MVCAVCGNETKVTNSRLQKRSNRVWRRRQCLKCAAIFTTEEAIDQGTVWLIRSSSGALRPFSRDQLFLSVFRACEHRKTALSDAGSLSDTIIRRLEGHVNDGRLDSAVVVQASLVALNRFDKTAATVYQAFHPVK
jgi:transcriptional repressor NrdR